MEKNQVGRGEKNKRKEITGKAKFGMRQDENVSRTQFTFCMEETESEKEMDKGRDTLRR